MKNIVKIIINLISLLFIFGCACQTTKRLEADNIKLGFDTPESIKEKLEKGVPCKESQFTKNDKQFLQMTCKYGFSGCGNLHKNTSRQLRNHHFYFYKDILVGYIFVSSLAIDAPDFDLLRVGEIEKGVTPIKQAIDIMGPPHGKAIYPYADSEDKTISLSIYYHSHIQKPDYKIYRKSLDLFYNQSGLVTDIDYFESGEK